jgi:Bacterial type II/III secretion system short domain
MPEHDFELYLSLLTRFLRISPAQRDSIADELRDHLEQRLGELEAQGLSREAAIRAALEEFGDAADLANHFTSLARIRKRRLIMRLTFGSAVALAALVLISTAFWPESPNAPIPQFVEAQLQPASKPTEATTVQSFRTDRRLVRVSNLPVHDIAMSLQKYFDGNSELQIVAEPVSNTLMVSAPSELLKEVVSTLKELDQPTRSVAVDVAIVELPIIQGAGAGIEEPLEAREFEGPVQKFRDKLQALMGGGLVKRYKRFHIQALNNQVTQSEDNEYHMGDAATPPIQAPTRTPDTAEQVPQSRRAGGSTSQAPTGARAQSSRHHVGTTVSFTIRVGSDKRLLADFAIFDSPSSSAGKSTAADGIDSKYLGTISIVPGRALVVNSIERNTASGRSQTLFIVSAEVNDPGDEQPVAANKP